MTSVIDIHNKFLDSIEESRNLYSYCRTPVGLHSSAGIESAFLDAFKAWEIFLNELIFAYLRGELDIAGKPVPTTWTLNIDDTVFYARLIAGGRRGYIDWVHPDNDVKPRLRSYFNPPLHTKLEGGLTELREMRICRNAIAHSSGTAHHDLGELWMRKEGTSKSPLRTADILVVQDPDNPPLTWFERYLQALEVLSQNLVQI